MSGSGSSPFGRETSNTGGGSEDWLTTYADAITLLLAFFVMILGTATLDKAKYHELKNSIEQAINREVVADATPKEEKDKKEKAERIDKAKTAYEEMKDTLKDAIKKKQVELTRSGNEITIELSSAALFRPGRATLLPKIKPTLQVMATAILSMGARGYTVDVEGHTDDVKINTPQFPSNWELSASRASGVITYLETQGLAPKEMRAIGMADTTPKAPNRNKAGKPLPANRAMNRRVVLHVRWLENETSSGPTTRKKKAAKPKDSNKGITPENTDPTAKPPAGIKTDSK
jgi:chemotaxis protein MotB